MADLDVAPVPRRRAANRRKELAPLGFVLTFTAEEVAEMHHNPRSAAGNLGGWPGLENWILDHTDPLTLECGFDAVHGMRLIVYYKSYDRGGPNARVRAACGPALKRIGIILLPGWGDDEAKE
jgi:hypothetical protein